MVLFLKDSESLGETDMQTVRIQHNKGSEMSKHKVLRNGIVKKGGICSGSFELHRGAFGKRGTGAITLLTGLLSN